MHILMLGLIGIAIVLYPILIFLKIFGVLSDDISWWILLAPIWITMIFAAVASVGVALLFGTLIALGA